MALIPALLKGILVRPSRFLLVVPRDRIAAARIRDETAGRVDDGPRPCRLGETLDHLTFGLLVAGRLGHEPAAILTARTSDFVLAGLLGVSGSRTVAVPTHAFTSDRSVVFV